MGRRNHDYNIGDTYIHESSGLVVEQRFRLLVKGGVAKYPVYFVIKEAKKDGGFYSRLRVGNILNTYGVDERIRQQFKRIEL